jgi:hypothetical protein
MKSKKIEMKINDKAVKPEQGKNESLNPLENPQFKQNPSEGDPIEINKKEIKELLAAGGFVSSLTLFNTMGYDEEYYVFWCEELIINEGMSYRHYDWSIAPLTYIPKNYNVTIDIIVSNTLAKILCHTSQKLIGEYDYSDLLKNRAENLQKFEYLTYSDLKSEIVSQILRHFVEFD